MSSAPDETKTTNTPETKTTERRGDLDFPAAYNWGGAKHADLLAERQLLLSAKFSYGLLPFTEEDWLRLQSIRGILDAIDEEREVITHMSDTTPTARSALEVIAGFLLASQPIAEKYQTPQEAAASLIGHLVREGYTVIRKPPS